MADFRQLPLAIALEPRFGEEDFLISDCNAEAYDRIENWVDWPGRMLLLSGPAASGKSHLATIWAQRSHARIIAAISLTKSDVPECIKSGAVVIEGSDHPDADEAALFHLLNLAVEREAFVLLSAVSPLAQWPIRTPDLRSRLRRIPVATISAPDDALIRALLVKMFVDRQLMVDTALIEYLGVRLERSFDAVRSAVDQLDRETLARGKRLTRPIAAKILGLSG